MGNQAEASSSSSVERAGRWLYPTLVVLFLVLIGLQYVEACAPYLTWVTPPVLLFSGLLFAFIFGTPYPYFNRLGTKQLLQGSVVGLGFGMNLQESLASGSQGMAFTIISVFGTLFLGMFIGLRLMKMDRKTSYLISSGTAICGGSAIAAVGPTIRANGEQMSLALGTVFILNAIALFIFPTLGRWLDMTDVRFGTWAAIAIHDTSSVVGAGAAFSDEALRIATLIKLTRALWIIPLVFISMFLFKERSSKVYIPWFIFFFIGAILVNTYLLEPMPSPWPAVGAGIARLAQSALVLTMFFIGASLSRKTLMNIGIKPLILGVVLWVVISLTSLVVCLSL